MWPDAAYRPRACRHPGPGSCAARLTRGRQGQPGSPRWGSQGTGRLGHHQYRQRGACLPGANEWLVGSRRHLL